MAKTPWKTVERLILYRRILTQLKYNEVGTIFSHKLAEYANCTSAQVRRDIMEIGYTGTPSKGYDIAELELSISEFLQNPEGQKIAFIGTGMLGRALIKQTYWKYENLSQIFIFDINDENVGEKIEGIEIIKFDEFAKIAKKEELKVAVVTVPDEFAQDIVDKLVLFGIKAIVNCTTVRLIVPDTIFVDELDMSLSIEKISYLSRNNK